MKTVIVVTSIATDELSMKEIIEPFRLLVTELISRVDIRGSVPRSNVLEHMNTAEFDVRMS